MNLRPKLVLTTLGVGLPLIAGLGWVRLAQEHSTAVEGLQQLVIERMEDGGREDCERWPESWPVPKKPYMAMGRMGMGPGAGGMPSPAERLKRMQAMVRGERQGVLSFTEESAPVEMFAYAADLTSRNALAPELGPQIRAGLLAGEAVASHGRASDPESPLEVAVRMDWFDEPGTASAYVLARQVGSSGPSLAIEFLKGGALVAVIMLLVLVANVGPVVMRVRRLTKGVRRAAADRYSTGVEVEGADEISELAQAFNSAGSELCEHMDLLEKRERSLREFVEGTTHDVLLPLTVLQGHLMGLRKRAGAKEGAILGDALEEVHYMASIVRNLGIAAKLDAGSVQMRQDPVDLVALCERVVARHRPVAREKGIRLESVLPGEALIVVGDGTLIEQAVSNLVHNAVRYVEPRGHVVVLLAAQEGSFSLCVLDDGPGIPAAQLDRLTERRWRADAARTRCPEGNGLGLAIAREIALRHGMSLQLSKAPQLGGLKAELRGRPD